MDAGEVGSGASVTALYEITPVGGPLASDPLRYQKVDETVVPGTGDELAYIKIRYKLPRPHTSKLMERPITEADAVGSVDAAPEATRWALAVAAFGQELRGDPWMETGYDWAVDPGAGRRRPRQGSVRAAGPSSCASSAMRRMPSR